MSTHLGQPSLSPVHRLREDIRPYRARTSRLRTQKPVARPTHPLLGEIERLVQACEAHEREIRACQNTINHQLAEWSGKFDTLHDIDSQAERLAFDAKKMLDETQSEHTHLVDKCVQDGEKWVKETQSKMESWNDEWPDRQDKGDKWELWKGKIQLTKGYYEGEQERLDIKLLEKQRTKRRLNRVVQYTCCAIMLFIMVVLVLLWMFEWR